MSSFLPKLIGLILILVKTKFFFLVLKLLQMSQKWDARTMWGILFENHYFVYENFVHSKDSFLLYPNNLHHEKRCLECITEPVLFRLLLV